MHLTIQFLDSQKFIDCVFSLKNISVHGNGKQLVDYLHKPDLMNLLKILVQTTPKTIYNVSSGNSKSIIDIAKIISNIGLEKFNQKIETSVMSNTKLPNSPKIIPNKIMKDYNWSPALDLESIIENEVTSPWIIRLIFDKELILDKGIIMEDIYLAINNIYSNNVKFIYSDENSKTLIGRISINSNISGNIADDEINELNGLEDQTDVISTFKNNKYYNDIIEFCDKYDAPSFDKEYKNL